MAADFSFESSFILLFLTVPISKCELKAAICAEALGGVGVYVIYFPALEVIGTSGGESHHF